MIMDKATIKKTVEAVAAAPSCCAELKEVCNAYLKALDTDGERAAAEKLLTELKADVCTIDEVIGLFTSPEGEEMFGAEQAAKMAEHAKSVKAAGGKFCDCPACGPGRELIEAEADILG